MPKIKWQTPQIKQNEDYPRSVLLCNKINLKCIDLNQSNSKFSKLNISSLKKSLIEILNTSQTFAVVENFTLVFTSLKIYRSVEWVNPLSFSKRYFDIFFSFKREDNLNANAYLNLFFTIKICNLSEFCFTY